MQEREWSWESRTLVRTPPKMDSLDVTLGVLLHRLRACTLIFVKWGFNPLHTVVERLKRASKGQFK